MDTGTVLPMTFVRLQQTGRQIETVSVAAQPESGLLRALIQD